MPNPVDADEFAPCAPDLRPELRKQLGLPIEGPLVVFVGRLAPEKELGSLIRAFSQVRRKHPEAVLALVGDGAGRAELEAEAGLLRIQEHVRFVGMTDMAGVLRWLHAADVFALVSSLEGFPCSLIEAMSAGLPPVVSDIPAMRQLVEHDANGLVSGLRDESSIAGNLSRLLGDADMRQRLGQAAREHVTARYSSRHVTAKYVSLLNELIHERSN
jgi:glycosyltransferase involved in cell wall biosynthesis